VTGLFFQLLMSRHSRSAAAPIAAAAYTHPGLVLGRNEDSFLLLQLQNTTTVLAAVADGLGGLEAGEVASSLVLQVLMRRWLGPDGASRVVSPGSARHFLKRSFREANCGVVRINRELSGRMLMGTTMAAAVFLEGVAAVAHCGDSRCYRLRDDTLRQLTRDHTLAELLVAQGRLRPHEASGHPMRHVLSRCLGARSRMQPVVTVHACRSGDRYLLCTDGLSAFVPAERIAKTLRAARTAEGAVKRLVGQGLGGGGADNITAVAVFF